MQVGPTLVENPSTPWVQDNAFKTALKQQSLQQKASLADGQAESHYNIG